MGRAGSYVAGRGFQAARNETVMSGSSVVIETRSRSDVDGNLRMQMVDLLLSDWEGK